MEKLLPTSKGIAVNVRDQRAIVVLAINSVVAIALIVLGMVYPTMGPQIEGVRLVTWNSLMEWVSRLLQKKSNLSSTNQNDPDRLHVCRGFFSIKKSPIKRF
ncbi:MAG: hypothetical protein CMI53_02285 [Parcubacteria group bacterium]|nr:hypothetical protein [Parcubacteria group bacterium]